MRTCTALREREREKERVRVRVSVFQSPYKHVVYKLGGAACQNIYESQLII